MDLNLGPDGVLQRPPTPDPDWMAARDVVTCFLLGLIRRGRTGVGGQFNVSLAAERVESLNYQAVFALNQYLQIQHQPDSEHASVPMGRVVQTADEPLLVMVMTDAQWRKLLQVIDRQDLLKDSRFATQDARQNNRRALRKIIRAAFAKLCPRSSGSNGSNAPTCPWTRSAPSRTARRSAGVGEPHARPHSRLAARRRGDRAGHGHRGRGLQTATSDRLQHSRDILRTTGFSDAEVPALEDQRIVVVHSGR